MVTLVVMVVVLQVIISDVELGFDSASHLYLNLVDGGALNKALL